MDEQRGNQSSPARIATSVVQVVNQYTGRGPTKAKATIDENMVTVLLADTLTDGERTLVQNGRAERVLRLRHDYQLVMGNDLVGVVERELHRKVIAFLSQNHIDPDLAVEIFVLKPADAIERTSAAPGARHAGATMAPEAGGCR